VLELAQVSRHFGGVRAVDALSLAVGEGEIVGLIGPNGSGKSTTVNLVSGLFPLTSGRILFRGQDLASVPVHRRLGLGIARTFQNIRLFGHLTVWQNLWVAQNSPEDRARRGFLARWLGGSAGVRREIGELLEFASLAPKQDELAANLAFGEQRRLELARALATRPKLLLLDEIAGGLTEHEARELVALIREIKAAGTTMIWIEHVMHALVAVADRIVAINFGAKLADGAPAAVMADPEVQRVYLGIEV